MSIVYLSIGFLFSLIYIRSFYILDTNLWLITYFSNIFPQFVAFFFPPSFFMLSLNEQKALLLMQSVLSVFALMASNLYVLFDSVFNLCFYASNLVSRS